MALEEPDAEPARRTLADDVRQSELERNGFTVVPTLDAEQLAAVWAIYEQLGSAPDDPQIAINWSFHSQCTNYKHAVKHRLLEAVGSTILDLLVDHRIYLSTFITKWPGPDSGFAPHQDPTLVDERRFRGVTIWIPLADTGVAAGRDNGMLHFVPGSHRFSSFLRTNDVDRSPLRGLDEVIVRDYGFGLPTTAGDAVVFDNRVIHYSMPNETDTPRLVLSFAVVPTEGRCVLVREAADDWLEMYEVHDDVYIDVLPSRLGTWSNGSEPIARIHQPPFRWSAIELADMCGSVTTPARLVKRGSGVRAWRDPRNFCAICGSTEGFIESDRAERNNAQLICTRCEQLTA